MFQITFYFNDRGIKINVQTSKLDLRSVGTLINLNFHLTRKKNTQVEVHF